MHPRDEIRNIEKEIAAIKLQHRLGKMRLDSAKQRIREKENSIRTLLEKLEPYEKEMYLIRREFGPGLDRDF